MKHNKVNQKPRKKLVVFTDGACSMNKTWTGGWGYLMLLPSGKRVLRGGYEYKSTNNRMEVMAILEALSYIRRYERKRKVEFEVEIISDSGYAVFPFLKYNWEEKWRNNLIGSDLTNYDLWNQLLPLVFVYYKDRLTFTHIRGHGKNDDDYYNKYNDIVDKFCVQQRIKADTPQPKHHG